MPVEFDALCKRLVDRNGTVSDVLREAKILAARRGIRDLQDWIDDELTGYTSGRHLPEYRKVGGHTEVLPGRRAQLGSRSG